MAQNSKLLMVPVEIRDAIYLDVVQTPCSLPDDLLKNRYRREFSFNPAIMYPCSPPSYVALLRTCRQVNVELSQLLQTAGKKSALRHRLDCLFRREDGTLWPTWTLFPALPQFMSHLEVDLRLVDLYYGGGPFYGCGGPGLVFKPLFELLNRFIHHGPGFFYAGPLQYPIHLQSLVINIIYEDRIPKEEFHRKYGFHVDDGRVTKERHRIFRSFSCEISRVTSSGVLTGMINQLGVRWGEQGNYYPTSHLTPSNKVDEEWERWGFHWGIETSATRLSQSTS